MESIITILKDIKRPGMDNVIEYMRASNFATASCYSHHTYKGGLVDHSLEVYDLMMKRRGNLNKESVAVCAFFHDLGKTKKAGMKISGHHPKRSVDILKMCDFQLTDAERVAILQHHKVNCSYFTHPLRHCLSSSDMSSTGKWKMEHPKPNKSDIRHIKNAVLYAFSKL